MTYQNSSKNPSQNHPKNPVREGGKGDGFPSKTEKTRVVTVHRLEKTVYDLLEKQLGHVQVNIDSSVHQVAYQLGIQKVLQVLRQGIVIGY